MKAKKDTEQSLFQELSQQFTEQYTSGIKKSNF
jgi:hypothetical protein